MADVMSGGAFIHGPDVKAFEAEFSSFTGAAHCVGVANGTDALELALRAAGMAPGAEVILPANTFIASAEAVVRAEGRPVLVDCNHYGLIAADQLADKVTKDTWGVMPVHLYGQMADMEALSQVCSPRRLQIVEDAAQAQGSERHGHGIGHWGAAAGTSFYPGKNLGAYGDAGAVLSNNPEIDAAVRRLANHGSAVKYRHSDIGCNSRLDTLQAVVLRAKLRRLGEWNALRRRAADQYSSRLEHLEREGLIGLPRTAPGNVHVWHLYVVEVDERDRVLESLLRAGVGAGIHYPTPLHLSEAFEHLGYRSGDFPVAESMAERILSLPLYPGITDGIVDRVVEVLSRALLGLGG
ncbi:MAG: DegT/DnrJ/EryC1/StrS family aminotransferase [Acidimicrobiaceae bacterium]|nr:DegT/DnrJ/EryC1/StrS family aminotransferase [Acidimicrobiaceae bacterium]